MSFIANIKNDFSLIAILLIPIAVAINFVSGSLALTLKLPMYLDSIGTFLVAMLAGPWVGGLTGAISLLAISGTDPTSLPWIIAAVALGVIVGLLARYHQFNRWYRVIWSTVLIVVASVLLTVIVKYIFFGGFSGHVESAITAGMISAGVPFWIAQFSSALLLELPDKIVTVLIPLLVIRAIPDRHLLKFSNGRSFVNARRKQKRGAMHSDKSVA